jgi:hypothetical protein
MGERGHQGERAGRRKTQSKLEAKGEIVIAKRFIKKKVTDWATLREPKKTCNNRATLFEAGVECRKHRESKIILFLLMISISNTLLCLASSLS